MHLGTDLEYPVLNISLKLSIDTVRGYKIYRSNGILNWPGFGTNTQSCSFPQILTFEPFLFFSFFHFCKEVMLNSRALDFCLVLQVTEFQPVVLIADEIMLAVLRNVVQDDYPLGGNTKINSPTCTCSILVFVNPIQGTFKINPLHF